eukprot:gene46769-58320_t
MLEVGIQLYWTADYRRFETHYATWSIKAGPFYIPVLELILCLVAGVLAWGTWLWLRKTYVGKALRASAEDADIAAAYGVDHRKLAYLLSGIGAAYAGVAGTFIALIATLAPAQIWAWLGVVFAVVIIGRLGNPLGALAAGMLIGASESIAMAVFSPAWAPPGKPFRKRPPRSASWSSCCWARAPSRPCERAVNGPTEGGFWSQRWQGRAPWR